MGPILAIDTSGTTASVAVFRDQVLAETAWQSGRRHTSELLPTIDAVLRLAGIDKHDLGAVAVAIGPGSYSGLRVGASTAMALALALDVEVVQVPTLEVMAWGAAGGLDLTAAAIRAAIDVGRGHFASARYRVVAGRVEPASELASFNLETLLQVAAGERARLVVDVDPEQRAAATAALGAELTWVSPAASLRRAGYLAELAAAKIYRGELVEAAGVEPIYLSS